MAEAELPAARWPGRDACVFGKFTARVKGEDLTAVEMEHDDCTCGMRVVAGELSCGHTGRLEPECPVKGERPFEVGYCQGDHMDAWLFHQLILQPSVRCNGTTGGLFPSGIAIRLTRSRSALRGHPPVASHGWGRRFNPSIAHHPTLRWSWMIWPQRTP